MNNLSYIKDRYLKDPVPIRLGGLAANLLRVYTFTEKLNYKKGVEGILNESKYFIEWTANETEMNVKGFLVDVQIQIAYWQHTLNDIWNNDTQKKKWQKKQKYFQTNY